MKKVISKFLTLTIISVSVLFAFEGTTEATLATVDSDSDPLAFDSLGYYWSFNGTAVDSEKGADLGIFLSSFPGTSVTGAAYGYNDGIINQAVHLQSNSIPVSSDFNTAALITLVKSTHSDFTISFYIKQDSSTATPNPWKHVIIRSQTGSDAVVYIDKVIVMASALDSWINGAITIDELRIYRSYLTDSQVSQLYLPLLAKRIHPASTPGVSIEEIVKYMQGGAALRRDDLTGLLGLIPPKSS